MKYVLVAGLLHLCLLGVSQSAHISRKADSLYLAKKYAEAGAMYLRAADSTEKFLNPKSLYYNAACCFALTGDKKAALNYLDIAVNTHGYKDYDHLVVDTDLTSLHTDPKWKKLIAKMKADRETLKMPRQAKLVTTDIHHFWEAYDAAQGKDSLAMVAIYREQYFNKGSAGLQDYFGTKINSIPAFVRNQRKKPAFYKAIRQNTLAIDNMKEEIYGYFEKMKSLYADAVFPNIYFVIGRWNSAGTASDNGLLLGVDQISRTPGIPQDELNLWEKNNYTDLSRIPVIVIHELIHFEQSRVKQDTTLLSYALVEGMADFLCELVTGVNPSQRQQDYAKTRRKEVWNDFKKEMFLARAGNWIANGNMETENKPADLGYYVGYEICKAYYEQAKDKKQAIADMLTIQDHKAFLEKSGYEEKVSRQ